MQNLNIAPAIETDLPVVLTLNENALPHLSSLTLADLHRLVEQSCYAGIARIDHAIAGFLLALPPGKDYQSPNYRWFCQRYDNFVYIDRIVVANEFQGMGLGRVLYESVERAARGTAIRLTCEVNLIPPNPGSLAFHRKLGFVEVGQQDTEGGKKRVSLLAKTIAFDA